MRKKTPIIKNLGNIGNLDIQSISIRRLIGGNKGRGNRDRGNIE